MSDVRNELQAMSVAMATGSKSVLRNSVRIVEIGQRWDLDYRAAHDNVSYPGFLREIFGAGKDLAWWRRRYDAYERYGRMFYCEPDGLVWLHNQSPADANLKDQRARIYKAYVENNENQLNVDMLTTLFPELVRRSARSVNLYREYVEDTGQVEAFERWCSLRYEEAAE